MNLVERADLQTQGSNSHHGKDSRSLLSAETSPADQANPRSLLWMQMFPSNGVNPTSSAPLPGTCTEETTPYQVIGIDFARSIRYKKGSQEEGKAYLALFACSL